LVGHDLSMCILYRFHGWLIFARVIALFMFVWPYACPHILCTQLVICLLLHFIHIWYLGWPWSEHAHILPISQMVDFCESYSPFHVCLTICPSAYLVYATSLLSNFIHIWYLGWPWSEQAHIIPISRMVDFCVSCSPFHVCLTICPFTYLVYATSLLSNFIHIWYLGWPWSEHAHIIPISRMVDFCANCPRRIPTLFTLLYASTPRLSPTII
jgi:hypothetical protein